MAEVVLNTIFQVKRAESYVWETLNPVLRQGEPGYDLDTGVFKVGDGVTEWVDLPSISGKDLIINDTKIDMSNIPFVVENRDGTNLVSIDEKEGIKIDLSDFINKADTFVLYGGNAKDLI